MPTYARISCPVHNVFFVHNVFIFCTRRCVVIAMIVELFADSNSRVLP